MDCGSYSFLICRNSLHIMGMAPLWLTFSLIYWCHLNSYIYQMFSLMINAFCDPFMKLLSYLVKLYCFTFHIKIYRSSRIDFCMIVTVKGRVIFFPIWISNWSSIIYYKRPPFLQCTVLSPLLYIKLLYMDGSVTGLCSVPLVYFSLLC